MRNIKDLFLKACCKSSHINDFVAPYNRNLNAYSAEIDYIINAKFAICLLRKGQSVYRNGENIYLTQISFILPLVQHI